MDEKLVEALKKISYPGFSQDIVTLDAVTSAKITDDGGAMISIKPISASDQVLLELKEKIVSEVGKVIGSKAVVQVYFGQDAPKEKGPGDRDESVFQRKRLPGVGSIIPVVSGKGGVGKSTVAINLANTLKEQGFRTGILDLDLFGPSIHRMLGINDENLAVVNGMIMPHEVNGLQVISIGMAMGDDEALVIRGPMVMKLLNQLLLEVRWGDLDYLIVDMPPGTGDIPLSLVQQLHVTGAVVVTTPQEISLIDVRRAVAMFGQTETKILGLIENMSYYKCECCDDVAHIFGEGGGAKEAERLGIEMIGQIPMVKSLREGGDSGTPGLAAEKSEELAKTFKAIAYKVDELAKEANEAHKRFEDTQKATPTFQPISSSDGPPSGGFAPGSG